MPGTRRPDSAPVFYRTVGLAALAQCGTGAARQVSLFDSVTVAVPALQFGTVFLDRWPVREEPDGASWREDAYVSAAPAVFALRDATVHSAAGIVCVDGQVIAETLEHTGPDLHGYQRVEGGITIAPGPVQRLAGTHTSALGGGGHNYFHAIMDGVGRLSALPPYLVIAAETLLFGAASGAAAEVQRAAASVLARPVTMVTPDCAVYVDCLLLPSTVHDQARYHPCLARMFGHGFGARLSGDTNLLPRCFYVTRERSWARRLTNEPEVISALEALGIVSVSLEDLPAGRQAALFRGAQLVVAPHGAGLANLLFASPGCVVLELQMDAYCNWCFRRLSALLGLHYDCVVGRAAPPWPDMSPAVHGMTWAVSVPHVVAAAAALLRGLSSPDEAG